MPQNAQGGPHWSKKVKEISIFLLPYMGVALLMLVAGNLLGEHTAKASASFERANAQWINNVQVINPDGTTSTQRMQLSNILLQMDKNSRLYAQGGADSAAAACFDAVNKMYASLIQAPAPTPEAPPVQ